MKIAIVGTGVSGLVAAHKLHGEHEIVVYEAAERIGGHSNTVMVEDPGGARLGIDTGFIVFNDRNYPNFEALLAELGVASRPSHMSFSVSDGRGGFEYSGTPWGLFARPSHLVDRRFLRMLGEWRRFNREARALIGANGTAPSLGHWLEGHGFSRDFVERLIVPQASAVWSADPAQMWEFPASFMAEFFDNHGMYSLRNRPHWRTVEGGSRSYVEAIVAPWRDRVRTAAPVRRIERLPGAVRIEADGCESEEFDQVVIAAHSDQALGMLGDPTAAEREVLGAIPYQRNQAVLHTDRAMMPRRRAAWSSWNFHLAESPAAATTVTYWMNHLQRLERGRDYFLTLNREKDVDPARILRRFAYDHPVYTREGVAAQNRHAEISNLGARTHYCGAYWGWGFHEDGVVSGLRVAEALGGERALPRPMASGLDPVMAGAVAPPARTADPPEAVTAATHPGNRLDDDLEGEALAA
jgi:predicted NAD/FAD-binding protein